MKTALAILALLIVGCEDAPPVAAPVKVDLSKFNPDSLPAAPAVPSAAVVHTAAAAPSLSVDASPNPAIAPVGRLALDGAALAGARSNVISAGGNQTRPDAAPSISLDTDPSFDLPVKAKPARRYPVDAPPAEEPDQLAVSSNPDVKPHQTIAIIYCQPGCVPCAMLIRDLKAAGWKVGHGDRGHFKIVELLTLDAFSSRNVPSTPVVAFFVDGEEKPPRIAGYDGSQAALAAIVQAHPAPKAKRVTTTFNGAQASPLYYETPSQVIAPATYFPSEMVTFSQPVVTSVVESVPVVSYPYSAVDGSTHYYARGPGWQQFDSEIHYFAEPTRSAPPRGLTVGPATSSAQLNLFGFPIIGGSVGSQGNW